MKILLAVGVVLAISVALSSAQCSQSALTFDIKTRTQGCQHEGKLHKIGSEWISACKECSCTKFGMSCCSMIQQPAKYDEVNCEAIYHEESCSYTVTRKDNPSEKCAVEAMVM